MALNGTINGTTSNKYITAKIEWTATQSISGNYSNVTATLSYRKSSASTERTGGTFKGNIYINGVATAVEIKTNLYPNDKWVQFGTATTKVDHNADGSKSISIKVTGGMSGTTFSSTTLSQSIALDQIPRAATVTSAPNFNDEQNPTIKYHNAAGNAVKSLKACISLDGSKDDIAYRDISKTGSSYTFNLTDAEREVLRKATVNANSRTVRFYVQTVIGDDTYRNNLQKTLTIVNAQPTLNPTVYDSELIESGAEADWYNPTGDTNTYFVKGWSDATYTIDAKAYKGATIKSQKVTCGTKSSTAASGTLSNVDSASFVFSVTDSRGNTVSKTINKTLVNYFKPTLNLQVSPPTAQGNMTVKVSGKFFNGMIGVTKNAFQYFFISYEEDGVIKEQFDLENSLTINGNNYSYEFTISNLNYKATYDITAYGHDVLFNSAMTSKRVKLLPIFDWGKDDFQFNVPVRITNGTPLQGKTTTGDNVNLIYLSASDFLQVGGGAYPPKRVNINTQNNDGQVYINGREYAKNRVLWSGSYYMTENQTATLDETISSQTAGVILVFSRYDIANGEPLNEHFSCHFVPKQMIELQGGKGHIFNMNTATYTYAGSKYLYIDDDKIRGNAENDSVGTGENGIKYNNNRYVLRYVIGV